MNLTEHVFICAEDETVWTDTAMRSNCPKCKRIEKTCGFVETVVTD